MNEHLIGEAVTLETSDGPESLDLVVGLARDLLVAAEAPPEDLETVRADLRTALDGLRREHEGSIAQITAELVLVAAGLEVRLRPTSGKVRARTVLCPI